MPVSDYHPISDALDIIEQIQPASVLDIGIGYGRWGVLCREILDIYKERVLPDQWTTKIEGIEIHEPFRGPLWNIIYNKIHIGDAMEIIDKLGIYDLIICGDMIEHFEKEDGRLFLQKMLHHTNYVLITSPNGYLPQGIIYGNEHEKHKSGWDERDFSSIPHLYRVIQATFLSVLSLDQKKIDSLRMKGPLDSLGVKKGALELLRLVWKRAIS